MLTPVERGALARAVALAAHPRSRTSPNPHVGCVLLLDGQIVGEGTTSPPPGPHAEVLALRAAGARARHATAVVTLEPCAHTGRTPPCTRGLVAAGVGKVIFVHPDPNPVARGGAHHLEAAGVEVVGPLGPTWRGTIGRQLEGFLLSATRGRPHITLKQACTADGSLLHPDGERWITGSQARRSVHRWRAAVDAVLVGVGTVLADDPRLDVREVPALVGQPRPVVLDAQARTPSSAQVVRRRAIVVTRDDLDAPGQGRAARLADAGAQVITAPASPTGRGVDLNSALGALTSFGIVSLLAEPGPILSSALFDAGLVDRSVRHIAVRLGPPPSVPLTATPPGDGWVLERVGGAGQDLIVQHVRRTT